MCRLVDKLHSEVQAELDFIAWHERSSHAAKRAECMGAGPRMKVATVSGDVSGEQKLAAIQCVLVVGFMDHTHRDRLSSRRRPRCRWTSSSSSAGSRPRTSDANPSQTSTGWQRNGSGMETQARLRDR